MSQEARTAQVDEIKAMHELAGSFARKELLGHAIEYEFPYALPMAGVIGKARETGLFDITLPLDRGGIGLGTPALAGVLERIGTVDAGMAGVLFTHAAALEILSVAAEGDGERCASVYKLLAEGVPLAFQSYASPREIDLPGVTGEGRHLLSGKLDLLSLGGLARYAVVPGARGEDSGFSYYLLDLAGQGVTKSGPVLTLGLQACQAVDVVLDRATALLIGAEGRGEGYCREMELRMSIPAAAISLGIMEGSFKEALAYTGQRYQGGRNIVEWSGVRMKLADMAVQTEAARGCLSGAISASEASPADGAAVAAALLISELACGATSEGVQLLGGNGYMKDYGQEKRMRDARQARSLLGMSAMKKMSFIDKIIEEARI
jgi:alkylation response protein AidB-like acyl-CoA dehydrogenase